MFLKYFGLTQQPFGVTPDPGFLYLSDTHREALASLIYGIEAGIGFSALIAKPGMGKTTLLYTLLKYFQNTSRSAFLFDTQCDSRELISNLLEEFEIDEGVQARGTPAITRLRQFLLRNARAKRQVLIVVDEAQNLDNSAFETLRLLSNFETPQAKLLQIILSGQPQLAHKLGTQELEQLRQRISVFCHLKAFTPKETVEYIVHRLKHAGYTGAPLFTPEALGALVANTFGIPREINRMCFNALSLGFAIKKQVIDAEIIQEVIGDLEVGLVSRRQDTNLTEDGAGDEELAALFGSAIEREIGNSEIGVHTVPTDDWVSADNSDTRQSITLDRSPVARDGAWRKGPGREQAGRYVQPNKRGGIVTLDLSASDPRSFPQPQKHETRMGAVLRRCGLSSFWGEETTPQRSATDPPEQDSAMPAALRKQRQASALQGEVQDQTVSQQTVNRRASEPANSSAAHRAGENESLPRLLKHVEPIYPDQARTQRLTGKVMLDACIRNTGEVGEVYVLSGHPILTAAAVAAVRQWLYAPALLNGKPQPSRRTVIVEFSCAKRR